jgi:hypothetical protein
MEFGSRLVFPLTQGTVKPMTSQLANHAAGQSGAGFAIHVNADVSPIGGRP